MGLSEEAFTVFREVSNDLLVAVKTGSLYDTNHPFFLFSLEKLQDSLATWFKKATAFHLGVSPTHLFLPESDTSLKEGLLSEIAGLLHAKGIVSVRIQKEVTTEELKAFLISLRMEPPSEEAEDNPMRFQHIQIQEVDYGRFLAGTGEILPEEKIWAEMLKTPHFDERLPKDRAEFFLKFFESPDRGAGFLNRLYRQALREGEPARITEAFLYVVQEITRYLEGLTGGDRKRSGFRANLIEILSRFHPRFLTAVLQETMIGGERFDLARDVLDDFSDAELTGLIESLIQREGSVNHYLMHVFRRLVPQPDRAQRIAPLVIDGLLSGSHDHPPAMLQRFKLAIRELIKEHEPDPFMDAMYRVMVDALGESDQPVGPFSPQFSHQVLPFVKSAEEKRFRDERITVLLEILTKETDPDTFRRLAERFIGVWEEAIEARDVGLAKEALSYWIYRIGQRHEMERVFKEVNRQLIHLQNAQRIVAWIPYLDPVSLDETASLLLLLRPYAVEALITWYLEHPEIQDRCLRVIAAMRPVIGEDLLRQLHRPDSREVRSLLQIVKASFPELLPEAARSMVRKDHPLLVWEALDHFVPQSPEEHALLLRMLMQEKNREIQKRLLISLLKGNDPSTIKTLFRTVISRKSRRWLLGELIRLSGLQGTRVHFEELARIFRTRPVFGGKAWAHRRLAAFEALCRIDPTKAQRVLEEQGRKEGGRLIEHCKRILAQVVPPHNGP